jgi:hypothetical protein
MISVFIIFLSSLSALFLFYKKFPKVTEEERQYIKLPWNIEDVKHLGIVLNRYKGDHYFQVMVGVFITYILYPFHTFFFVVIMTKHISLIHKQLTDICHTRISIFINLIWISVSLHHCINSCVYLFSIRGILMFPVVSTIGKKISIEIFPRKGRSLGPSSQQAP